MARLSVEIVENVTGSRPGPGARPSAFRTASSDHGGVGTGSWSPATTHRLLNDLALIERQPFRADDLVSLVTLARKKNGVPGACLVQRGVDRGKPVRDSKMRQ